MNSQLIRNSLQQFNVSFNHGARRLREARLAAKNEKRGDNLPESGCPRRGLTRIGLILFCRVVPTGDQSMTPQILTQPPNIGLASIESIRARFPALQRQHSGKPVAYFDGPGGTQVPREVAEAMNDYLFHHNANTHWNYPTSEETDAAVAQ